MQAVGDKLDRVLESLLAAGLEGQNRGVRPSLPPPTVGPGWTGLRDNPGSPRSRPALPE
ncbi:MAG: hypothetical protein OXH24_01770 [Cyanobacteria bacterium MAG IRC3_bin_20]|nr:hypothetical protein [Cyanobacteria bacterium MAG IRC3_bin_20]